MTGVHSRAIASATAAFAGRTRRQIAVWLLPFVFLLYIINYLDRTSVAYAAIGMARDLGFDDRVFGLGIGIFFLSYVALQIPGLTVERARADLRNHDRVGIAHRTHGSRAHSRRTLPRALLVRRSRSRFLSWSDRLSEPLVHPGGPGESDEQLHGCNSCIAGHRIPRGRLDT